MRILVIDDERAIRSSLRDILQDEGHEVAEAGSGAAARTELGRAVVDLVLLDIKLGQENGIDLLAELRKSHPHVPVIMVTGHGSVALATQAFKLGARDFLEKPLRLVSVRVAVRNALESVELRQRVAQQARSRCPQALYRSQVMRELYAQVSRLSSVDQPVVITGPSGAGKELVAQALHCQGPRVDGPFVATNTASVPLSLSEDELFGHERGAFTGASARRQGCLERADKGTLLLDEVADMDPQLQAKLLRVLETGTFTRLGGTETVSVNVRVVAATHKDLEAMVRKGTFRQDLWFRLCAFVLRVPALEERREDIALLAEGFLTAICTEMNIARRLSDEALRVLTDGAYPGNVRQLKHVVTRAAVFCEQELITAAHIERAAGQAPGAGAQSGLESYLSLDYRNSREQFERDYLAGVLRRHNGNITASAAAIGMAQSNLSRKLKQLGIRPGGV